MLRQCKATQKVLVLDCCHAGGKRDLPVGPSSQELGSSFRAAKGLITLASCSERETSSEWEARRHGLFTYCLAEGLGGAADANKDGLVDSDELYAYTLDQVTLVGQQELNAGQTPVRMIGEDVVGREPLAAVLSESEPVSARLHRISTRCFLERPMIGIISNEPQGVRIFSSSGRPLLNSDCRCGTQ